MPTIPFTELNLEATDLTAAAVAELVPALRLPWGGGSGLRVLKVGENELGDDGLAALAKALPPTLSACQWASRT